MSNKIGGPVPTYKEIQEEIIDEPIDIAGVEEEEEPVEEEVEEPEEEPTFEDKKEEPIEVPTVKEVKVADDDKIKAFVDGFTEMKSKLDLQTEELSAIKETHAKELEKIKKENDEELKKIKSALRRAIYG